jgi:lipoprotein-releasing system permease protein
MNLRFTFQVAFRYLIARRRATLITAIGVGVGVFVMTVMQSMMFGFQGQFMDILLTTSPHVLVKGRERGALEEGRVLQRTAAQPWTVYHQRRLRPAEKERGIRGYRILQDRISELAEVTAVAPMVQGSVILRYGTRERGSALVGVEPPAYDRVLEFRNKIIGDAEALTRQRDGIILGTVLAEELGIVVGQRVTLVGAGGQTSSARVVAFFQSGITYLDRISAFVNLPVAQSLLDLPSAVTGFVIKVEDHDRATIVARRVEYATGLESQSWQEASAVFFALLRQQNTITFGAVALTVLVAGFGIANGLIASVLEKRRDIGILRALGLTPRGIAGVFMAEGVLVGLLGTLIGLVLAAWMIAVMASTPLPGRGGLSTADTFQMLRGPTVYLMSTGFALTVSLIASFFPALRAARYEPVEIIRTAK